MDNKEDNETLNQDPSASQLELSNFSEIHDQITQDNSLPLCFESFQLLKEMRCSIFKEKDKQLVEVYEVAWNPICHRL